MPNTKFNRQTLDAIEAKKAEKIAELNDWTIKKIESTTNEIKDAANNELNAEFEKIDATLKYKLDTAMDNAEDAYNFHIQSAEIDSFREDKNQEKQIDESIYALSLKYNDLAEDEISKYKEKEKDINQKLYNLSEEKKAIQKELENAEKAVADKRGDIDKVRISMDELFDGYKFLSEVDKGTRDEKMQSLHEDLHEYNQQLDVLAFSRDGLEEKLKKCNEDYANLTQALKDAFDEYKKNEENLRNDLAVKKAAIEEDLANGKKKRELDLAVKKSADYKEQRINLVYEGMKAEAETENSRSKRNLKEKKDNETNNKINRAAEKIKYEAEDIKDRVVGSVDIEFELGRVMSLHKTFGHTNTDEFKKMTDAVKDSYLALGKCDTSKEAEDDILSKCVDAYRKCQNYIAKKDRKSSFLEYFRSDFGKERLLFASDMMVKLKKICPGLEDALKAENANAVKDEVQQEAKEAKGPKRDVKGELDALKKEYQKNNKNQNNKNLDNEPKKENVNLLQ